MMDYSMSNLKFLLLSLTLMTLGCAAPGVRVLNQTGGAASLSADKKLKLTRFVAPEYPAELRASGIQGEVHVRFLVQPDGSVTDAHVAKSAHPRLDELALAAVSRWKFERYAHQDGSTVKLQTPVTFKIDP
jgi:TonB family protein